MVAELSRQEVTFQGGPAGPRHLRVNGRQRCRLGGLVSSCAMVWLLLRFLACCLVAWLAWRALGPTGLVYSAVLFAITLAGPLLDLLLNVRRFGRVVAFRAVQGRYRAYRGIGIDVQDDLEGRLWLCLADVRKVLPGLRRDESLRALLGDAVQTLPPDKRWRIEARALVDYLSATVEPDTAKFRGWVERSVIFPHRHRTPARPLSTAARDER